MKKGFTLIELLVVIAIIGILSSVILASLSTAREGGKAAAIKESMNGIRSQMELYHNPDTAYGDNDTDTTPFQCEAGTGAFVDLKVIDIQRDIVAKGATNQQCSTDVAAGGNDTAWAYSVTLPGTSGSWCIDSTGYTGSTTDTTASPGDGSCN